MGSGVNESRMSSGALRVTVCLVLAGLLPACTQQHSAPASALSQAAPPETIATTRQVMLGITIPTSDVLFQVGAAAPKDDLEWEKVQASAAALAESANLLLMGSRAVDQNEWNGFCQALITTSKAAALAAQERDVDKVLDVGNQIYEVCDGCHRKYMAARQGEENPDGV